MAALLVELALLPARSSGWEDWLLGPELSPPDGFRCFVGFAAGASRCLIVCTEFRRLPLSDL
jgi:hypothetical protein